MTNVSLCLVSTNIHESITHEYITVGKTLAYTSIKFLNPEGDLFARGSHTKYVIPICILRTE